MRAPIDKPITVCYHIYSHTGCHIEEKAHIYYA